MASFSADLHVAGHVIPLLWCAYEVRQDTDTRGRVSAKARRGPVCCRADVPPHQLLEAWAADHAKQLAATVLFREADGGTLLESLHLPAAYCVRYAEAFEAGDVGLGAYTCAFELADPQGWSWQPGAPANPAAMQPAPREHGTPPVATVAAAVAQLAAASATPDVPLHLPAPQPQPSPDHRRVHLTQAEWQALTAGRWDRHNNKNFFKEHRNTEFYVQGSPFVYRSDSQGKIVAVYDAQKSYNVTGTRKGVMGVPLTLNAEPTFAGTPYTYPPGPPHKVVVQIKMAGNRKGDFRLANKAAGLANLVKQQGRRSSEAPKGYTWHHRDDFAPYNGTPPPYGTCTMELVKIKAHEDTFVHYGSCDQCNTYYGANLYE